MVRQANALLSLLWPLNWPHTFIPVLPHQLLPALGSPAPFMIGVPLELRAQVDQHVLAPLVQLNLDDGRLWMPQHSPQPHAPAAAFFEATVHQIQRPQRLDNAVRGGGGARRSSAFRLSLAALEWVGYLLDASSLHVLEVPVR